MKEKDKSSSSPFFIFLCIMGIFIFSITFTIYIIVPGMTLSLFIKEVPIIFIIFILSIVGLICEIILSNRRKK